MQGFHSRGGPAASGTAAFRRSAGAVRRAAAGLAMALAVLAMPAATALPALAQARAAPPDEVRPPAEEPVFLPGSRIGIAPPPGMTPSRVFSGFEDPTLQVALEISELAPQSYPQVARQFTPEMLSLHGTQILRQEDVSLQNGRGLLIAGRPAGGAPPVTRWSMLAHFGDVIAVVTLLVPDAARDAYPDAAVRRAFASLTARGRLSDEELLGLLPFKLGDLAGFRVLRARPDGTVMLTSGPADTPLPVQQPFLLIALRTGEAPAADEREAMARRALAQIMGLDRVTITHAQPIRFAGRQGHEILGETQDMKDGVPLALAHWIAFGAGLHLQVYGIARAEDWAAVLPRMRAVRDGIEPK